jgi:DNA-binding transcriptional LysR family regulator
MQDLNDLRFFAGVVEQNGFAAAARKLGMPRSRLRSFAAHCVIAWPGII